MHGEGGQSAGGDETGHGHGGAVAERAQQRPDGGARPELHRAEKSRRAARIPALGRESRGDDVRQDEAKARYIEEEWEEEPRQAAGARERGGEQEHAGGSGDDERAREDVGAGRVPQPVSAVLLLATGGYIVYYWLSAGGILG